MSTESKPLESLPEFLARTVLQHRLLLVVLFTTVIVGTWEFRNRGTQVDLHLAESRNFTDVMARLYPNDSGVQYMRAQQLTLCLQAMREGRSPPSPCEQFTGLEPLTTVRGYYERGIATSKHIEDLYYDYALFLRFTEADDEVVDAAVDDWRRNFPLSERPDPRSAEQSAQFEEAEESSY